MRGKIGTISASHGSLLTQLLHEIMHLCGNSARPGGVASAQTLLRIVHGVCAERCKLTM